MQGKGIICIFKLSLYFYRIKNSIMSTILKVAAIFTILLCGQPGIAQIARLGVNNNSEHFSELSDTTIKNEVALFNMKGGSMKTGDANSELVGIPIRHCTDKAIHLSKGSTFISVYFKEQTPNRALDSIFLVTHSHFWVRFPDHAFEGIYAPHSCDFSGGNKKDAFFSPYYTAFYSKDRRRLYIYMQGGTDANKYEVTWVIVNGKYHTRIVDSIL
jgi:hypothetical protein